jgi:hypothetical protein
VIAFISVQSDTSCLATATEFYWMAKKKSLTYAGKPAFRKLKRHLAVAISARGVEWEHRLGELVDQLCPRGKRAYGSGGIEKLAEELESPHMSANRLWNARKLAAVISGADLADLTRGAKAAGFGLRSSHVLSLAIVKDEKARRSLGAQCVAHRWDVTQLRRQIHTLQGKISRGGAKVLLPRSVDEALLDLLDRSKNWLRRHGQAWFAEGAKGLSRPMSRAARDRLGGELDEAVEVLRELRDAADAARRLLRQQRTGTLGDQDSGDEQ